MPPAIREREREREAGREAGRTEKKREKDREKKERERWKPTKWRNRNTSMHNRLRMGMLILNKNVKKPIKQMYISSRDMIRGAGELMRG